MFLEREEGKGRGRKENRIKNETMGNIKMKKKGIDLGVTQRSRKAANKRNKNAEFQGTRRQYLN